MLSREYRYFDLVHAGLNEGEKSYEEKKRLDSLREAKGTVR